MNAINISRRTLWYIADLVLAGRGSEEALALSSAPDTPPPETRELNLIDALRKLEGEDSLGVLQEEDEITSEESSGNGKDADSSRDVVHIRPSTAPGKYTHDIHYTATF